MYICPEASNRIIREKLVDELVLNLVLERGGKGREGACTLSQLKRKLNQMSNLSNFGGLRSWLEEGSELLHKYFPSLLKLIYLN